MSELAIRPAVIEDAHAIRALVHDAYRRYVERMGREPAPMSADYERLVRDGLAWVLVLDGAVTGLIILRSEDDHLLVSNVAVAPGRQGRGLGRRLLDFAEAEALRRGLRELRLFTNEQMHENLEIYARLGWSEHDRGERDGFRRVFMRKPLAADPATRSD